MFFLAPNLLCLVHVWTWRGCNAKLYAQDMDLVVAVVTESSTSFERCFGGLLNEIHDAAAFSTLLALLENDDLSAAARWQLVDKLAEWPLLLKVATHVFESGRGVDHVEVTAIHYKIALASSSGREECLNQESDLFFQVRFPSRLSFLPSWSFLCAPRW